jgi:hypothetical protein
MEHSLTGFGTSVELESERPCAQLIGNSCAKFHNFDKTLFIVYG